MPRPARSSSSPCRAARWRDSGPPIGAASLAQLDFGVLVAGDEDGRARRVRRLGIVEATFDPLPLDADVCQEWGRLSARSPPAGERPAGVPSTSRSPPRPASMAFR